MNTKRIFGCLLALLVTLQTSTAADNAARIPNFVGSSGLTDASGKPTIRTLRFLTTLDFPPFSFLDEKGRLTGFNVYLAKAICSELAIQANCTVQAMPFEELIPAIVAGRGDVIIAGLAPTSELREQLNFSNDYLRFPARFVSLKSEKRNLLFDDGLKDLKIGVIAGSGHEKLARSYFPQSTVVGIANQALLTKELIDQNIDLLIGDGLSLSFWIHGDAAKNCCAFVGGAYYSSTYLGEGMRIAALNARPDIIDAINKSLQSIQQKHGLEELFLRFFPNSFY